MSRTQRARIDPTLDWWGKRPMAGHPAETRQQKWWKRRLHKLERKLGRREAREQAES